MSIEIANLSVSKGNNVKPLGNEISIKSYTSWETKIIDVAISPAGTLWCTILRPDLPNSTGGYLMIYKDSISANEDPIIKKFYSDDAYFRTEIASNKLDFKKNNYVIAYSPRFENKPVVISASTKIILGKPEQNNYDFSECDGLNIVNSGNGIMVAYNFDQNPLGSENYQAFIVARKGNKLGEGQVVGKSEVGGTSGIMALFMDELNTGEIYNIYIALNDIEMPLAGNIFEVPQQ